MMYRLFGLAGPIIAYSSIFFSILLTPSFDWSGTISDLGIGSAAFIFNSGMIIAGALLFAFSIGLLRTFGKTLTRKAVCTLLLLSSTNLALIGIFSKNYGSLHTTVSVMFFLFVCLASFLAGLEFTIKKEKKLGALITLCAIIFVVVWISPIPIAFQELFSSLAAFVWVAIFSIS